jgi:hypothetical protein
MLSAFSIDKTLNKNGRIPSDAPNLLTISVPILSWFCLRWSESRSPDVATLEGEEICVPIHS